MSELHTLPPKAQEAILESLTDTDRARYGVTEIGATKSLAGSWFGTPSER